MAALCTFVVVNCSAVSDVWIRLSAAELAWSSSSGVPGSGSSTGQLHLTSSSQVPLKFRFLIYYSTTLLEIMSSMFPRSSLSAGQTRLLATSDVLLQMYCLRKYCRHAHLQRRALTNRTVLCWSVIGLARGIVTKLWVFPPKFTSNLPPKFTP